MVKQAACSRRWYEPVEELPAHPAALPAAAADTADLCQLVQM